MCRKLQQSATPRLELKAGPETLTLRAPRRHIALLISGRADGSQRRGASVLHLFSLPEVSARPARQLRPFAPHLSRPLRELSPLRLARLSRRRLKEKMGKLRARLAGAIR